MDKSRQLGQRIGYMLGSAIGACSMAVIIAVTVKF